MSWAVPSTARVPNQSRVTGPNARPTRAVPNRWEAKSTTRMAMVIGSTKGAKIGVATSSPSIALSTEIAGVIAPSP